MANEQTLVERTMTSIQAECDKMRVLLGSGRAKEIMARHIADTLASQSVQITELQAEVERLSARIVEKIEAAELRATAAEAQITDLKRALDTARKDALEEAARLLEEGYDRVPGTSYRSDGIPSKNDQCAHGTRGWEDCEECAIAAIRYLQTKDQAHDEE